MGLYAFLNSICFNMPEWRIINALSLKYLTQIAICFVIVSINRKELYSRMGKTAIFADLNSAQAFDLSRLDSDQVDYYRGVPMTADIDTNSVFLAFRSPYDMQHPNRPYLHLMGYLNSVNGQMPYGITKFVPKYKPYGDIIYEFSNSEIASLANKGLYERDFKVPDKLTGAKLKIPVTCDFALVKPDKETNTVLVYGKIKNINDLHISSRNTDYVFANDFEKAESLLPHKDVVKDEAVKTQEDELAQDSIDFGAPDNVIDFDDDKQKPVFDDQDTPSATDGVLDLDNEDEQDEQNSAESAEKRVQDLPKIEKKKSKEDIEAEKVFKRAQKHMKKRKEAIKKESVTAEKSRNNKSKKDTALEEQIDLQAGRQSKIANQIADDEKAGIVEESVPDTPNDFDAIGDDDYGRRQSRGEREKAEIRAVRNGEINEGANKKAMAKHHETRKSIQELDSPVPVDDVPDNSLDLD